MDGFATMHRIWLIPLPLLIALTGCQSEQDRIEEFQIFCRANASTTVHEPTLWVEFIEFLKTDNKRIGIPNGSPTVLTTSYEYDFDLFDIPEDDDQKNKYAPQILNISRDGVLFVEIIDFEAILSEDLNYSRSTTCTSATPEVYFGWNLY
ncbi:hypothetical protein [Erythrobacter sp. EC-HK427]|uniref:hypothetical protein n=1 Tax=Erythrobacter sp. EC-HK427 TaxID=2038396 RepID=UPI0012518FBA|nr:hypothetical protein [Erythrobacter sp. EC-HK427]VVT12704.1 hypothetical protein ERY430_60343 [Erythrobacter sp. EC-HK427]